MSQVLSGIKVLFPADYDEQSEFETPSRGYLSEVVVEAEDGQRYQLFFIDPVRLAQEVQTEASSGQPCFAEPNMVILPRVTTEAIRQAATALAQQGFFQHLKPLP